MASFLAHWSPPLLPASQNNVPSITSKRATCQAGGQNWHQRLPVPHATYPARYPLSPTPPTELSPFPIKWHTNHLTPGTCHTLQDTLWILASSSISEAYKAVTSGCQTYLSLYTSFVWISMLMSVLLIWHGQVMWWPLTGTSINLITNFINQPFFLTTCSIFSNFVPRPANENKNWRVVN